MARPRKANPGSGTPGGLTPAQAQQLAGATLNGGKVPKVSNSATGTTQTSTSASSADYGLDTAGLGTISSQVLPGANTLFGQSPIQPQANGQWGIPQLLPRPNLTAQDTVTNFLGLTGPKLATIQQQMYQAGDIYPAGYKPTLGTMQPDDIAAFKRVVLGFAVNPSQQDAQGNKIGLDGYLNSLATQGKTKGASQKSPLVVKLANPDDLRVTLQDTAQKLYGQYLPDDQVNKFIQSFQSMQTGEQTAAYSAGGYNPETGQQDLSQSTAGAGATTVIAPPSPDAAAQTYVKTNYPNQAAATQFGNAMQGIMDTLKNPAA